MNLAELQKKLIAAARAHPPSEVTPYAFEKRIMAQLAARPVEDVWLAWGVAMWRSAAACVALSILTALLVMMAGEKTETRDLETTVFAAAQDVSENW